MVDILMVMNGSGVRNWIGWARRLPQFYGRIMLFAVCSAIDIAHNNTQLLAVVSIAIEIAP